MVLLSSDPKEVQSKTLLGRGVLSALATPNWTGHAPKWFKESMKGTQLMENLREKICGLLLADGSNMQRRYVDDQVMKEINKTAAAFESRASISVQKGYTNQGKTSFCTSGVTTRLRLGIAKRRTQEPVEKGKGQAKKLRR